MTDAPTPIIIVGLTGGSGAGKGHVCELLREYGVPCLDTDRVAHDLYTPGHPCLDELHACFPPSVFLPDGTPDRARLGDAVFHDPAALARLNGITHRYIRAVCDRWLTQMHGEGHDMAVLDAPVLFESGFADMCRCTVGVLADTETRVRRIVRRDGIPRERALARIAAQHDDAFFMSHCTYVLRNPDGADLRGAVRELIASIRRDCHETR